MRIYPRVHHWPVWWLYAAAICAVVALVNVVDRDLSSVQLKVVIIIGALFWLLAGLGCYGYEDVRTGIPPKAPLTSRVLKELQQREWHAASEFVLPGNRKSVLPPKY